MELIPIPFLRKHFYSSYKSFKIVQLSISNNVILFLQQTKVHCCSNCSNFFASSAPDGLSSILFGMTIFFKCMPCRPCLSIGPSDSERISDRTMTMRSELIPINIRSKVSVKPRSLHSKYGVSGKAGVVQTSWCQQSNIKIRAGSLSSRLCKTPACPSTPPT